jgi:hypothetical protein
MGFTAVRYGDGMSGMFFKDGARLAGARSELMDDFARQAVKATAQKVFRTAGKKFAKMTLVTPERQINAWDFYCYGRFRNGGAFRDRLISDFIRFTLDRWIKDMSDEMRWLIEMSACNCVDVEEDEILSREIVLAVIMSEINGLVTEHGRSLHEQYLAPSRKRHQAIANGASPLYSTPRPIALTPDINLP